MSNAMFFTRVVCPVDALLSSPTPSRSPQYNDYAVRAFVRVVPLYFMASSGTSGKPKLIAQTADVCMWSFVNKQQ